MESVQQHIIDHHYYHSKINPGFNKKIDEAIDLLYAAYSSCKKENEQDKYSFPKKIDLLKRKLKERKEKEKEKEKELEQKKIKPDSETTEE